ncbi:MAG: metal-dependent hydrolase [Myxococcota bacterium]
MRARLPDIDFRDADGFWLPSWPEFTHRMNGASLLLPYLEPYLIRVMKLARSRLESVAPALLADVDLFNRQEANHYKVHARYNAELRAQYPGLEPFEAEIKADFQRFLAEEPLEWNLAYSEGFESVGLIMSEFFLQEIPDALEDADPAVRELWAWHLAEEFEHRSVVHDVLAAVAPGWVRRLQGFRFFGQHLYAFTARVCEHMTQIDRERGRLRDDDPRVQASAKRYARRESRFYAVRTAQLLTPWYRPHGRPLQAPTRRVLESYPQAQSPRVAGGG